MTNVTAVLIVANLDPVEQSLGLCSRFICVTKEELVSSNCDIVLNWIRLMHKRAQ